MEKFHDLGGHSFTGPKKAILCLFDQYENALDIFKHISHLFIFIERSWSLLGILEKASKDHADSVRLGFYSAIAPAADRRSPSQVKPNVGSSHS